MFSNRGFSLQNFLTFHVVSQKSIIREVILRAIGFRAFKKIFHVLNVIS